MSDGPRSVAATRWRSWVSWPCAPPASGLSGPFCCKGGFKRPPVFGSALCRRWKLRLCDAKGGKKATSHGRYGHATNGTIYAGFRLA